MCNEIMVSICCLAYNHEKYIRVALESFVKQKTNFKYEILIHDDASTDKTTEIIREYEKKYPDLIKPIYQKENQYSKGIAISSIYQYPRAKGKYVALCEGDDFWIDEYKLQKQFDALEKHSECSICTHIVNYVDESGNKLQQQKPFARVMKNLHKEKIISSRKCFELLFVEDIVPFQTSSFFLKTEILKKYIEEKPEFSQTKGFGDVPLIWYFCFQGSLYYIPEILSSYRCATSGNWTTTYFAQRTYRVEHYQKLLHMFELYNIYTQNSYKKEIDEISKKYEFALLEAKGEYQKLLRWKYKKFLKRKSFKEIAYIMKKTICRK